MKMTAVVTSLDGLTVTLQEIKGGIANSRPTLWTVIPIALAMVSMIVAGVVSVTTLRSDIASLRAVDAAREGELSRLHAQLDKNEEHTYQSVKSERDYWRAKALGGGSGGVISGQQP